MTSLTVPEQSRRRDLRRMKALALGFFVGATVLFLLARWQESRGAGVWAGYVAAGAEAGMVGALADWFAVTALFRHPLGLPIPHTAIIPSRKEMIGDSLAQFVGENFLTGDVVRDRLRRAGIVRRIGGWLEQPDNAERVAAEAATALRGAVTVLQDAQVQDYLHRAVTQRLAERDLSPTLGRLLGQVVVDGGHRGLVDLVARNAREWVEGNPSLLKRVVRRQAPTWTPAFLDDVVADRLYGEVLRFAVAVDSEPDHPLRGSVDAWLGSFAKDLQEDPDTRARAEAVKQKVVGDEAVRQAVEAAWQAGRDMLVGAAADPGSELRSRLREGLAAFGARLAAEPELQRKVEVWLEDAAVHVVSTYRAEVTALITDTVAGWDAEQTSRKVELQVGRDLQFIRINGTVVGALAGLAIYAVTRLLF